MPCSPVQLVREIDGSQRDQLEGMIRDLEDENRSLQLEYQRLRGAGAGNGELPASPRDQEMLNEARLLRQHKGRLETRMQVLEEHNRQLEQQLSKLRRLLDEVRERERGGVEAWCRIAVPGDDIVIYVSIVRRLRVLSCCSETQKFSWKQQNFDPC